MLEKEACTQKPSRASRNNSWSISENPVSLQGNEKQTQPILPDPCSFLFIQTHLYTQFYSHTTPVNGLCLFTPYMLLWSHYRAEISLTRNPACHVLHVGNKYHSDLMPVLALFKSFQVAARTLYAPALILTTPHVTQRMFHHGVRWVDPDSSASLLNVSQL